MARAGKAGVSLSFNRIAPTVLVALALAGCDSSGTVREASRAGAGIDLGLVTGPRAVERDVPAPQVFDVTESGLWDGRPSLGGVWVAHPTARDPERVIIRNTQTGREVIGALFRRERENPGPRFQISSEAASALGILAGQPTVIAVTALRLERVEPRAPAAPAPAAADSVSPVAESAAAAAEAAPEAEAPRRGLRDLFRRGASPAAAGPEESAPAAAAAGVGAAPAPVPAAAPLPAVAMPAAPPTDTVAITLLDPEPSPPRRGLRDLFGRRDAAPISGETAIAATPLAPAAPVAGPEPHPTALAAAAVAPSADAEPGPAASGRGLRELFRRQPATGPVPGGAVAAPLAGTALVAEPAPGPTPGAVRPAVYAEPTVAPIPDAAAEAGAAAPRRGLRDLFRRQPEPGADPTPIPLPAAMTAAVPDPMPASLPRSAPAAARTGERPFIQIGIFAVEDNARRARAQMQAAGLPAEIRRGQAGERVFWRVVVGPAGDAGTQAEQLQRVRGMGFADAFAVAR